MEDSRWLRFVTAGLVLAAIVVAYFLITGRFSANKTTENQQKQQASRPVQQFQSSPTPAPQGGNVGIGTTTPSSGSNSSNITTLPNTGYPAALIGIFSVSAMVSGYYLRKYPR